MACTGPQLFLVIVRHRETLNGVISWKTSAMEGKTCKYVQIYSAITILYHKPYVLDSQRQEGTGSAHPHNTLITSLCATSKYHAIIIPDLIAFRWAGNQDWTVPASRSYTSGNRKPRRQLSRQQPATYIHKENCMMSCKKDKKSRPISTLRSCQQ